MKDLFEVTKHSHGLTNRHEYLQKNGYSCGYYCARAMINSLGNGNDRNLKPLLRLTSDGVGQNNLIRTLRARNVGVSLRYDLTLSEMERIIGLGKYIIVYDNRLDHWLVLGGVDGTRMHFYDPEDMWNYKQSDEVIDRLGNFGIVCSSKNT